MKDDALYLRHVQECIAWIEEHTEAGRLAASLTASQSLLGCAHGSPTATA